MWEIIGWAQVVFVLIISFHFALLGRIPLPVFLCGLSFSLLNIITCEGLIVQRFDNGSWESWLLIPSYTLGDIGLVLYYLKERSNDGRTTSGSDHRVP